MKGYAEAQVRFVQYFLSGTGVARDVKKSLSFAERAIAQKYGGGYRFKGDFFAEGSAGPVDMKRAVECYRKGTSAGDDLCMVRLAAAYENGGVPVYNKRGMSLYGKASKLGCGFAKKSGRHV